MADTLRTIDEELVLRTQVDSSGLAGALVPVLLAGVLCTAPIADLGTALASSFVEDAIVNGVTTKAPSQNAVFDALALKIDTSAIGVTVQGYSANLTLWSAVVPSSYLTTAAAIAGYQPLAAALTSWAAVTRAAGFDAWVATPSSANLATLVSDETGTGALVFATSPALTTPTVITSITPATHDGAQIGSDNFRFSDIYLAAGATLVFGAAGSNDVTVTHSTNALSFAGASSGYSFDAAVNVNTSGSGTITVGSNGLLIQGDGSNGYLRPTTGSLYLGASNSNEVVLTTTAMSPAVSDGNALGTTALAWSDLFLASGGVINWNNGDVTVTHSANTLAFAGASSGYSFDAGVSIGGGTTFKFADPFFFFAKADGTNRALFQALDAGDLYLRNIHATGNIQIETTGTGNLQFNGSPVMTRGATETVTGAKTFTSQVAISSASTGLLLKNTATDYLHTIDKDNTGVSFTCNSGSRSFRFLVGGSQEVEIIGGAKFGNPTGGFKGLGTINATAVYDDNTLLTCYIVEAWKHGQIDLAKWDALAPNREHPAVYEPVDTGERDEDDKPIMAQRLVKEAWTEARQHVPARGFAKVAADRLDIDKFSQFVWENERLPAFPAPDRWADMYSGKMATGDLLQRLWETSEVMAVHSIEARKRELALIARVDALQREIDELKLAA